MTKQILNALNSNIDFIQLKLYDFSDEKIDQEKIISERLNKYLKIENELIDLTTFLVRDQYRTRHSQ